MSTPLEIRLAWEDPVPFTRGAVYHHLVNTVGVYAIFALGWGFLHPHGASSLLYVGQGDVGERLTRHAAGTGDPDVYSELVAMETEGGSLLYTWAPAEKELAQCAETELLAAFLSRYGAFPPANQRTGNPCVSGAGHTLVHSLDLIGEFEVILETEAASR